MNDYTKLFTDLINVDVDIEEEDKAVILLNSLLDNGRQSLNYNDVSAALVNYEVKRKDKKSSTSSTSAEALVLRGRSSNQKGKGVRWRSKSRPGFRYHKKN